MRAKSRLRMSKIGSDKLVSSDYGNRTSRTGSELNLGQQDIVHFVGFLNKVIYTWERPASVVDYFYFGSIDWVTI